MKSLKSVLIALLALTTLGGAGLAWQQYVELVELRAAAMNKDERAELNKRVWDLAQQNRELQAQLAALHATQGGDIEEMAAAPEPERPNTAQPPREGRGGRRGEFAQQQAGMARALFNNPEVQALISTQQRAAIDARYAALFRNLNLTPEQAEKFKRLLAERQTTMADVVIAAREQGISPRENQEAFRKLISDTQNQINDSIKTVVGEAGFAQLQNYERTLPQRNLVNDLQQRLSYSDLPLTPTQTEQLVQILATNTPTRDNAGGGRGPGGRGDFGGGAMLGGNPAAILGTVADAGGRAGGNVSVTDAAVAQAQTVLAPPQLAALQQIQQQQQAQRQLQRLMRETLSANQPNNNRTGGGTSGKNPSTPGGSSGTAPRRGGGG